MKATQLTRGMKNRLMYVENKGGGLIDGAQARIGWVSFSKTGRSVYYRGRSLARIRGGAAGNFIDLESGEEFWVSGVKARGSNTHPAESRIQVAVDEDAVSAYELLRRGGA